jgi:hypothetical protein
MIKMCRLVGCNKAISEEAARKEKKRRKKLKENALQVR